MIGVDRPSISNLVDWMMLLAMIIVSLVFKVISTRIWMHGCSYAIGRIISTPTIISFRIVVWTIYLKFLLLIPQKLHFLFLHWWWSGIVKLSGLLTNPLFSVLRSGFIQCLLIPAKFILDIGNRVSDCLRLYSINLYCFF